MKTEDFIKAHGIYPEDFVSYSQFAGVVNMVNKLRASKKSGRMKCNACNCTVPKDYFINGSDKCYLCDTDIDTIGKCANCGVEYHIHKSTFQPKTI